MLDFEIIKETAHWIAINKPCGLNVEQLWDYPSVETQVKQYLKGKHTKEPFLGIVHRLDRPVSGVLLLAKRKQPLKGLNKQFANREIKKTYWAITEVIPEKKEGFLEHYLLKDQKNKKAIAFTATKPNAFKAKLHYKVIQEEKNFSLLEIQPFNGKFHQIRVQLAAIGCPIFGDFKYGGKMKYHENGIALHARKLSFKDPNTGCHQEITASVRKNAVWIF